MLESNGITRPNDDSSWLAFSSSFSQADHYVISTTWRYFATGMRGAYTGTMIKSLQGEHDYESRFSEIRTDLAPDAVVEISGALRLLLADVFGLYIKTKSFHWHMTGRSFRDFHLLLDEHSDRIFAMTDDIAERARKIGGSTIRSISDIARHQRLKDNNKEDLTPKSMLLELRTDNLQLAKFLRSTHEICERHNDVATAAFIENWIDETERRTWFLSEIVGGL
jgi:starvation-inducible DNA-binding protein